MARKAGLRGPLTTMVGCPWGTWDSARPHRRFRQGDVRQGICTHASGNRGNPVHRNSSLEEARRQGWLRPLDWDRYDMREPVLATSVSDERLMELTRHLYGSFLTPQFITRKLLPVRSSDDARFLLNAGRAVMGHLRDFAAHDLRGSPSGDGTDEDKPPDLATRRQA